MKKFGRYKRAQQLNMLYVLIYFLIAIGTGFFARTGEVFPLFNGHWFVKVPYKMSDFGIYLKSIDGVALQPPKYLDQAVHLFPGTWHFAAYGTSQKFGQMLTENPAANHEKMQDFLNNAIFKNRKVEFELHQREYDILEFQQKSQVLNYKVLWSKHD